MLPLSLKVLGEHLSLSAIIAKMTSEPARILNLEGGTLKEGSRGDVVVFDPDEKWTLDKKQLKSKSKNTPFHGHEMVGRVSATIVQGNVVYRS